MQSKYWIAWNIFLACVPVALAYILEAGARRFTVQRRRVPWVAWLPLGLVWFAFLPNACYLFTEWRHFLFDTPFTAVRVGGASADSMIHTARQGLVFILYSAVGITSFALAIRPVHRLLRKAGVRTFWLAPPFFFLTSIGVYLGLILRLNSWDLFRRPLMVLGRILDMLDNFRLLKILVIFSAVLWLLYVIVDIWVDGLKQRFELARKAEAG